MNNTEFLIFPAIHRYICILECGAVILQLDDCKIWFEDMFVKSVYLKWAIMGLLVSKFPKSAKKGIFYLVGVLKNPKCYAKVKSIE